ncbi:zinc ribbon domain-containing protein [Desulfonatronospira sp.]|uniref:FmdB family zinc ribbon protein n=1 Tax=Desulfonatronospira sp. TaxID=1962951 RepID=UPI003436E981
MPIYEYFCPECNRVFEELVKKSGSELINCPDCRKDVTSNRCISAGTAITKREPRGYTGAPPVPSCGPT